MKLTWATLFVISASAMIAAESSGGGRYTDHPAPTLPPIITVEPFLPPDTECWDLRNKFSHPPELHAPRFTYPFEFHGRDVGEATILVQIDEYGFPKRLAVYSATGDVPARLGIEALKKARWWVEPNAYGRTGVWFFYKAEYHGTGAGEPGDKPNKSPEHNALTPG